MLGATIITAILLLILAVVILAATVNLKGRQLLAALDDLKSAVENETSVITSAVTLINGFADRIEAVKGNETAIEQEVAQMRHNAEVLATAVQANTADLPNPSDHPAPTPNPEQ